MLTFFDPELTSPNRARRRNASRLARRTAMGAAQGSTPATAAQGGAGAPTPQARSLVPFVRAARAATQQDFSIGPFTLTATNQNVGPVNLQANGWLRSMEILVQGTSASNTASVAFNADGPFNVIESISMLDPAGNPIVNPISGYYLYLWIKYGVFDDPPFADPRSDPQYSVATGMVTNGGSFTFLLKLPVETTVRDDFTILPNGAADRRYRLNLTLNSLSGLYATQPSNAPSVTIEAKANYYIEPPQVINGAAVQQTPNGYGSKGYLEFESPQVVGGGSLRPQLFNMGRTIRAQIMVLRNASGVRDTTDWPDPFYVFINNFQQLYLPKSNWITAMERAYGYGANGAAVDTAGGLDTGVFVLFQYMLREGKLLNSSPRGQYLATVAGTKYVFQGVFGAGAQTLDVLQHSVVASAQALYN